MVCEDLVQEFFPVREWIRPSAGIGTTSLQCDLRLTHCSHFIQFVNSADNMEFSDYIEITGDASYEVPVSILSPVIYPNSALR